MKTEHLNVGELIKKIQSVSQLYEDCDGYSVYFDFCGNTPVGVGVHRWHIPGLSIEYDPCSKNVMLFGQFKDMIEDSEFKEFTHYKGAIYEVTDRSLVWVDKYGSINNTGVTGLSVKTTRSECRVIINTAYFYNGI